MTIDEARMTNFDIRPSSFGLQAPPPLIVPAPNRCEFVLAEDVGFVCNRCGHSKRRRSVRVCDVQPWMWGNALRNRLDRVGITEARWLLLLRLVDRIRGLPDPKQASPSPPCGERVGVRGLGATRHRCSACNLRRKQLNTLGLAFWIATHRRGGWRVLVRLMLGLTFRAPCRGRAGCR
jgi:hypothetical protein